MWAEEAQLRDADMEAKPDSERPADEVFREARSGLKGSEKPASIAVSRCGHRLSG